MTIDKFHLDAGMHQKLDPSAQNQEQFAQCQTPVRNRQPKGSVSSARVVGIIGTWWDFGGYHLNNKVLE
jgi:hypothetical protein